jgi:AcrR family transcriptional regulator
MSEQHLPATDDVNRTRLIDGLSAALAEKGYGDTTITDIVRCARVSKRTFYEYFEDKEACFLAAYRAGGERTLLAIAQAVDPAGPWEEQVAAATSAYLRVLGENAALTRTFLLEIQAAGPRALDLRRETHRRFADLLRRLVQVGRKQHPHLRPLSSAMATAIVGGIHELVLVALESPHRAKLRDVEKTAVELMRAVLSAPRS